jgi:hypothetical protein
VRKRARRQTVNGFQTLGKGDGKFFPAELGAFLDVIDLGGHRVLRVERRIDQDEDARVGCEPVALLNTIPKTVRVDKERVDDDVVRVWFLCPACRDNGKQAESFVDYRDLSAALTDLLARCRDEDMPRSKRYNASDPGTL